jgi:hypothetical protein
MDPYLENPCSWRNLQHRLITAIAIHLGPQLRPKYRVVVEEAMYQTGTPNSLLVGIPDVAVQKSVRAREGDTVGVGSGVAIAQPIEVELPMPSVIRQGYLEIRDVATSEVVTVLEVLSPTNKRPGEGRLTYAAKRQTILASATNFVEIDLLRQWSPLIEAPEALAAHYRILVSASTQRPRADLYAFNLQNPLPVFPLPLGTGDPEPSVDLKVLLDEIYDQSGYDLVIDYREDPVPPLVEKDDEWLAAHLQQQGLR